MRHLGTKLTLGAITVGALTAVPAATALASGAPGAASAFATAVITPKGGSISGFGITATFAKGAVSEQVLAIITSWPNGLDVAPPSGHAVKTFGLQICNDSKGTISDCTSEFGNYPNSPKGTERINGQVVSYTGPQTGVNFGTLNDKLVSFTIHTGATAVYIYNPNYSTTTEAYPKLLPSKNSRGVLTFQTFQPIVWTLTSPTS
ncbi:MAG: hypothetical protein M0Z47_05420 [Actinomycetota bacterium]|nr:hypothetical protein [Actinomycetota bacterium]